MKENYDIGCTESCYISRIRIISKSFAKSKRCNFSSRSKSKKIVSTWIYQRSSSFHTSIIRREGNKNEQDNEDGACPQEQRVPQHLIIGNNKFGASTPKGLHMSG